MPRRPPLSVIIIGALLGIALLHAVGVLSPVENALRWALLPLARTAGIAGFELGERAAPRASVGDLQNRLQDMEARLTAVSVDYVRLKALEEENRSLKEVAKFLSTSGYDHVGARIIARSTDPLAATVLIDRGARDGLENGMAVIAGDGIFVGKISALRENVATVLLVSDRRSRIAASPAGAHRLFGMVQGQGNGVAGLTLVPQAEPLTRDDIIVTAGTEDKIPANLAVALVNDVEGKATDAFKTATLEPLAQADALSLVVVLRPVALRPDNP